MATLAVWMNGERVGSWTTGRTGKPVFRYARDWTDSPNARAISLSLPITADREIRGPVIDHYFDNLLPDNANIRRRIRDRFQLRSQEAFDLLEAVGRDCVGAVQILPPDEPPTGWDRIEATPLSTAEVARILSNVAAPAPVGGREGRYEEFRISIAGAQEKIALLKMGHTWHRPNGATPTTHILKLPLGIVGNFRGDFPNSVENEWLCAQLLQHWGLPVAKTEMAAFDHQQALVVERFDRQWVGVDAKRANARGFKPPGSAWIARLPQEDFCQATGRPPTQRYECDGGASMNEILQLLRASAHAEADSTHFLLAQLAFWLLAATDGHSKNFSIHLEAGGAFTMTPLYDVLSAWPMIGRGARQLAYQDAKLAMAVVSRNRHYRLQEIQTRHWHALAMTTGGVPLWHRMLQLVEEAPQAFDAIVGKLPQDFPESVLTRIRDGVAVQCTRFVAGSTAL
jgi:serine/threonine-protein kinase HipA